MFIGWGFPGQNIPGSKIRIALTSGYMLATIVLAIMVIVKKIMTFTEVGGYVGQAASRRWPVFWRHHRRLGRWLRLHGAGHLPVRGGLHHRLPCPRRWFPCLFIIGAVISFATGTSWGTMAIPAAVGINMASTASVCSESPLPPCLRLPAFGITAPPSPTPPSPWPASRTGPRPHPDPLCSAGGGGSFIAYLIVGVTQMAAASPCRWRWRFWWCCSCWLPGCAARKLRKKVEQL